MGGFDDREQAAYERTVALFRAVDPALGVGDGAWTARDVLAHLCNVARRYTSVPRLGESPREVDLINAEELDSLGGLAIDELLETFARRFVRYREFWVPMGAEQLWPFHGGGQLPTMALRANWLGEMLVHGYDVAVAAGADWPVGTADALDLLDFLRLIVLAYAHTGDPLGVGIQPDDGPGWTVRIGPDEVTVSDGVEGADAVLAGPAWSLVLVLYQRVSPAQLSAYGVAVEGDPGALDRFLAGLEKP